MAMYCYVWGVHSSQNGKHLLKIFFMQLNYFKQYNKYLYGMQNFILSLILLNLSVFLTLIAVNLIMFLSFLHAEKKILAFLHISVLHNRQVCFLL